MPATQVFEKHLNPVGGFFGPGSLMKVVAVAAASESNAVSGRCGYLDNNGEWVAGPPPTRKGPPLFIFRGLDQRDIFNDGSGLTTTWWWPGNAQKRLSCFVGTGGFEFQTTEYTGTTPNNGDALTVASDGRLQTYTGALYGTTAVVGFCTPFQQTIETMLTATSNRTPIGQNMHLLSVLNFHTHFLPST